MKVIVGLNTFLKKPSSRSLISFGGDVDVYKAHVFVHSTIDKDPFSITFHVSLIYVPPTAVRLFLNFGTERGSKFMDPIPYRLFLNIHAPS